MLRIIDDGAIQRMTRLRRVRLLAALSLGFMLGVFGTTSVPEVNPFPLAHSGAPLESPLYYRPADANPCPGAGVTMLRMDCTLSPLP